MKNNQISVDFYCYSDDDYQTWKSLLCELHDNQTIQISFGEVMIPHIMPARMEIADAVLLKLRNPFLAERMVVRTKDNQ